MRKLIAEILDPGTTYELEAVIPTDLVRAMEIDAKFASLLNPIANAQREWRATYSLSTLSIRACQPSPLDLK